MVCRSAIDIRSDQGKTDDKLVAFASVRGDEPSRADLNESQVAEKADLERAVTASELSLVVSERRIREI